MHCDLCKVSTARWHQLQPLDRYLCSDCAAKDHAPGSHWRGEYDSAGFKPLASTASLQLQDNQFDVIRLLLQRAINHLDRPITDLELAEQRRSWVVGNLLFKYPNLTRKEAEDLYSKALANRPDLKNND